MPLTAPKKDAKVYFSKEKVCLMIAQIYQVGLIPRSLTICELAHLLMVCMDIGINAGEAIVRRVGREHRHHRKCIHKGTSGEAADTETEEQQRVEGKQQRHGREWTAAGGWEGE